MQYYQISMFNAILQNINVQTTIYIIYIIHIIVVSMSSDWDLSK